MRSSKWLGWLGLVGLTAVGTTAIQAAETRRQPEVRVLVDPRVELLSVIFRLAGNPEYNQGRVASYTQDVEKRFGPFRKHAVIDIAQKLRRTQGVGYDACMSLAVHLVDAQELAERVPLDPRPEALDARWPAAELRDFLAAGRRFVAEAEYTQFTAEHRELYELTATRMRRCLEQNAHLEWFDDFFGARPQARFTVALGLLNGGSCYGPHFRDLAGKEDLYCVLGVWRTDQAGQPVFDAEVLSTVVHEFSHSYANAIIEKHEIELKSAGEKIFPAVAPTMRRMAYGNWKTMFYESLVRASVLRYTRRYEGVLATWRATLVEKSNGFAWIDGLADLLGEYETQREKYATLEDFAPRLVAFFNAYAEKAAKTQAAVAAEQPQVVSLTPAAGATDVDPKLDRIVVVFDRPMQDNCWSLVGGGPNFPEIVGRPSYDAQRITWTVQVRLKPGWQYQFQLNSDRFQAFQSAAGVPLAPLPVTFSTRKP